MSTTINELVHLPSSGRALKFELRVGGGQSGDTTISIGNDAATSHTDDFSINIPNSDDLDGKRIKFVTVCSDVNTSHNKLLVTVELIGLSSISSWTMNTEVSSGGSYTFEGVVEFFK